MMRVEGMRGKHGRGRGTGTLMSTMIEIACTVHVDTTYSLDFVSSCI